MSLPQTALVLHALALVGDEDIAGGEEALEKFVESVEIAEIAAEQARLAKIAHDQSIADLDDELVKYYEKTGKIFALPTYQRTKNVREIKL